MVVAIVIAIIVLAVVLAGIGAYIVIQDKEGKEEPKAQIDRSGAYAVLRRSPRESITQVKPTTEQLQQWMQTQALTPERLQGLLDKWNSDLLESIRTVEEGDKEGIVTYRIILSEKDVERCTFLTTDNYITREQIQNHPELLPPYYLGCDCRLVLKQPWDNPSKSGWKAVLPDEGVYKVPDWRQLA